jgi:hypothetical protein
MQETGKRCQGLQTPAALRKEALFRQLNYLKPDYFHIFSPF